ncbi:RCC1 domain-containing protein 1 isoform X3 [Bufo bufo]|uniref:RCC1 domain-containing protein 1 isoform X3 n=1 Tax=Bufo bufo TaxID=8384 RepID=UPI001ABE9D57|nr:RCC1 domain-containing protein 1 isoform X3 [Bufo bufo]
MRWFAFGYGGFGQLGAGEELALTLPTPVQVIDSKEIVKAVPSWSYTALVTDEGSLQLSGCIRGSPHQFTSFPGLDCHDVLPSEKYLLVLMKDRAECWDVTHLDCEGTLPEPMWKMALSDVSSTAFPLVAKGHVLPQPPFFRELTPTLQAKKMALGNEHAVLVTSDGKVLTWGAGRYGRMCHFKESGDLYCWGWNESGQLGLPSKALQQERVTSNEGPSGCQVEDDSDYIAIQPFPALIDLPQETEAAKISCGSRHTAALNRCGELYTWGWGKYGQLGHGDTKTRDQPKRVEFFYHNKFCVKDVTCRHWNTYVMCVLKAK